MKYFLKNKVNIFLLILLVIIGFFIGRDINDNFLSLYMAKISNIPSRYSILVIMSFVDYFIFKTTSSNSVIYRFPSFYNYYKKVIIYEIIIVSVGFIAMNIPIMLMNSTYYLKEIKLFLTILISNIVISLFFSSIIKIICLKIKKIGLSTCLFILVFAFLDFLIEHYNFFIANDIVFDFSYVYAIPYYINWYYLLIPVLAVITFFLNMIFLNFIVRSDYFLGEDNSEKN